MKINFYNSLTNKVEEFVPQVEGKVSMYVCGPTVYNYPHIGNMRPVVIFDTLRRFLTYVGYDVTYVSNFTDVDDKIIKAAKEKNISEKELSEFFTEVFKQNTKDIGSMIPNITPKVTEYIQPIINYIDNYIFNTYSCKSIILRPFKRNIRAVKCYQKCGYKIINEYDSTDTLGNKERVLVLLKERGI